MAETGIFKAIQNVMRDVGAIRKEQRNTQQNYTFRGIDDIYNAFHGPMVEHGVFGVPKVVESFREVREAKKGIVHETTLKMMVTFYCVEDGSWLEVGPMVGTQFDYGDKSANKAMTAAYKYLLFQLFCIPTEDKSDGDFDSPEVGKAADVPAPAAGTIPENAFTSVLMEMATTQLGGWKLGLAEMRAFFQTASAYAGSTDLEVVAAWTKDHARLMAAEDGNGEAVISLIQKEQAA